MNKRVQTCLVRNTTSPIECTTFFYLLLVAYQPIVELATGLLTVAVPLHVAQSEGGSSTVTQDTYGHIRTHADTR